MGFNFSGMMQGLGGGLVATGKIMEEQTKLNWETEQARLKYERELHMDDLRAKRESTAQQAGFTHDETMESGRQKFESGENTETRRMQTEAADRAYGAQMKGLSIQEQQARSAAGYQSSMLDMQKRKMTLDEQEAQSKTGTGKVLDLEGAIAQVNSSKTFSPEQKGALSNALLGVSDKVTKVPEGVMSKAIEVAHKAVEEDKKNEDLVNYVEAKAKDSNGKLTVEDIWKGRTESQIESYIETAAKAGGYHIDSGKGGAAVPAPASFIAPENIPEASQRFQKSSPADQKNYIAQMKAAGWDQKTIDAISLPPTKIKKKYGVDIGELLGSFVGAGVTGVQKVGEGARASVDAFSESGRTIKGVLKAPSATPQDFVTVPEGYSVK